MTQTDILAIGDITTDAFIRLKDAEVHCNINKEDCELCVAFGQKIPFESVNVVKAVGNSANAAVSASKLGLNAALLAYVGDDQNGKDDIEELKKNNVDIKYVRTEIGKHTNYHYVLWYDVDRTILVKHDSFSYTMEGVEAPKWIYLSSLGESSLEFHMQVADFLDKNPETKLAFQPGTFQIKMGKEKLERIYKHTDIFFCNIEESETILGDKTRDLPTLLKEMEALGPKTTVLTDGINGAYAYNGTDMYFMPIYPHVPQERTGAGDAFASTVVSMIVKGKTLEEALTFAPINSMSVTQEIGAQKGLLTLPQIEDYLTKAPEDYKLKKI